MSEARARLTRMDRAVLAVVMAVPLLVQAAMVKVFGVNMPIIDELYYVPFVYLVRTGGDWPRWILMQHNEHRMVPMKLLMAPLSAWTAWNVVAEMYASIVIVGLTQWGLWRIFRRASHRGPLLFLPVAVLLGNPAQWFNMLVGMQMAFYFTLLGLVWSYCFLQEDGPGATLAAPACGFLTSFSTITGFVVWPIGLVQLLMARAPTARIAAWSASAAACALLYFRDYESPPQIARPSFIGLGPTLECFLAALGAPLSGRSGSRSVAVGVLVALGLLAWLIRDLRRGGFRDPSRAAVYALTATGVAAAAAVTLGRGSMGLAQVLESRYVTFTELALVGLWVFAVGPAVSRVVTAASALLLAAGLAAAVPSSIKDARSWRSHMETLREILLTYDTQPWPALERVYFSPSDLVHYAPYLEHERLSAFHDQPPRARGPAR
jgi:hypothetical protein